MTVTFMIKKCSFTLYTVLCGNITNINTCCLAVLMLWGLSKTGLASLLYTYKQVLARTLKLVNKDDMHLNAKLDMQNFPIVFLMLKT